MLDKDVYIKILDQIPGSYKGLDINDMPDAPPIPKEVVEQKDFYKPIYRR